MSNPNEPKQNTRGEQLSDIPFEAIPLLATSADFHRMASRLRELRAIKDELFDDKISKVTGTPIGEYERLRLELGAMVAVAGVASVTFIDLRIANTAAGETRGKVTGPMIIRSLGDAPTVEQLLAIARSATALDEDELVLNGIPPFVVAQSREPGKPRKGSTRVEWVGKRGPGANAKQGSGGAIQ